MTTTFQDVDLVIDEILALFTANASWEAQYGYFPGVNGIKGYSPVLVLQDDGTQTLFANQFTNPVTYQFLLSNWVIAFVEGDRTVAQQTELRRSLNKTIRQIIRNNTSSLTYADTVQFGDGFSTVDTLIVEGVPYFVETFTLMARLSSGSKP